MPSRTVEQCVEHGQPTVAVGGRRRGGRRRVGDGNIGMAGQGHRLKMRL